MPKTNDETGSDLVVDVVRHVADRPALISVEVSERTPAGQVSKATHLMTPDEAEDLVSAIREAVTRSGE